MMNERMTKSLLPVYSFAAFGQVEQRLLWQKQCLTGVVIISRSFAKDYPGHFLYL